MGVRSDLVLAPKDAAEDIRASDDPASEWEGFSFTGMDNVKFATLLSLLSSQSPSTDYEKWSDGILPIGDDDGPLIFSFADDAVGNLATIASREEDEIESLARQWAATEEFEGWKQNEVSELLRNIGDLAETATLEKTSMFLRISL